MTVAYNQARLSHLQLTVQVGFIIIEHQSGEYSPTKAATIRTIGSRQCLTIVREPGAGADFPPDRTGSASTWVCGVGLWRQPDT